MIYNNFKAQFIILLFSYLFPASTIVCFGDTNSLEFTFLHSQWKWKSSSDDLIIFPFTDSRGNTYLKIKVREEYQNKWNLLFVQIPVETSETQRSRLGIRVESSIRISRIEDSIGAGIAIHFLDPQGKRIETIEERLTEPTEFFVPVLLCSEITPDTHYVKVAIFLHQRVEIEVYEPKIVFSKIWDDTSEVLIKEAFGNRRFRLIGFGVEDDGRFYDAHNQKLGVDERGKLLREVRLNYLNPHWIRTFVWFKEWSPNENGKNFTWNSDGFLSLCKTLEYYQSKKIPVNLTCVTWGMENPWDDIESRVNEIIAMLNYLKKVKKFTCIKYFTLTNEPNYFFHSEDRFRKYVSYHHILFKKISENNLDVKLIGSDDAMGTDWFQKCLADPLYVACVDTWASHFYWNYTVVPYAYHLFDQRVGILKKQLNRIDVPFVVTEFGIIDSRFQPPFNNPLMEEYDGALYTVSAIIDGLNSEVRGVSIWCLQEVAYPGGKDSIMRIGLWGYVDKNWQVFPIFHAFAMFSKNTMPGELITPLYSSHPETLKSVKVGNKIFFANTGYKNLELNLSELRKVKSALIYTGDANNPYKINKKKIELSPNKLITLPPRSFGFLSY